MNNELFSRILVKTKYVIQIILQWIDKLKIVDFIAPLALRLYLAPVFWMAGVKKFSNFTSTAEWFGNDVWVFLVGVVEILGAVCLLLGVGVRLISIPLMVVMVVAALKVHLQNGWLAIAEGSGFFANDRTIGAIERLDMAKSILKEYGNYQWLTDNGSFVVLNNGIEFAATYFIMLLVLFFIGAGRFVSLDYWIKKKYNAVTE